MNNRLIYLDYLRSIAIIAVITVHVSGYYVVNYNTNSLFWLTGCIFDAVSRVCVPLFLLITGALLMDKEEPPLVFIKKRVPKLIFALILWQLIYITYMLATRSIVFSKDLIKLFIFAKTACHFWYLPMIIGLYIIFPVVSVACKKLLRNEILFYLILWLILMFIDFLLKIITPRYQGILYLFPEFRYLTGYIGYIILGYYLVSKHNAIKRNFFNWSILLISLLITVLGATYISRGYSVMFDYLSPNIIIMSVSLFLIFKNLNLKSRLIYTRISQYSFGIYLVHIIILYILKEYIHILNPLMDIPVTVLLCFIFSFMIIWLLYTLKINKYFFI